MKNKSNFVNVFLVDDNPIYLKMLEKSIMDSSFNKTQIRAFSTGEECLKNLHENPTIIVLDYFLNKEKDNLNGIETLKKIRKKNKKTKIIMLSGQDDISVAVNSIKNGAFDYIDKNETAFVKTQNSINNIILRNKLEFKASSNRFWLRLTSMILFFIIISAISISIWNPIL